MVSVGLPLVKKEQVGLDAGVGGEDAIGQADNRVKLAVLHEELFDLRLHAFAKERAIRKNDSSAPALVLEQLFHDEDKEHVGSLAGADVAGVITADSLFLQTAERWIGDHAIHALGEFPFVPAFAEGIAVLDHARHVDAVEHHVGDAEEMGKLLLLDAADAIGDGGAILGTGFFAELLLKVTDGGGHESTGSAGGVHHSLTLFQAGVDHLHHELGEGAWSVELPGIARAAQVIEDLFIHVAKLAPALDVVEVDGFVQLLDDRQHLRTGLHVVVGVPEDLAHDSGLGRRDCLGCASCLFRLFALSCQSGVGFDVEFLESGKYHIVNVPDQLAACNLRLLFAFVVLDVFGPVPPSAVLGNGRLVFLLFVGSVVFPGLFALVENFEEQHPGELADALGVAIDTVVFAHDVLDGLDGGG
jgi:hypothetical protein